MSIVVTPSRLKGFGSGDGRHFCLVTNPSLLERFKIEEEGGYRSYRRLAYDGSAPVEALFAKEIPEDAHVLLVSSQHFVESPADLGRRKLMALPCGSTPTGEDALAHFLAAIERTDPEAQAAAVDRFFELAETSEHLRLVDPGAGTDARFGHRTHEYEWNEQVGPLEWGEQQIAPSGEVSALPADIMSFSPELRVDLEGEIALRGIPVLHSGKPSFGLADQQRIYERLATAREHAVIATVEGGRFVAFRESHPDARPAREMLDDLCEIDSRYRIVWEMGFGLNENFEPWPGNSGMNEVYGGRGGRFHLGVGLTPYTQYALIFICEGTRVLTTGGEQLVGPEQRRSLKVRRRNGCDCYPS